MKLDFATYNLRLFDCEWNDHKHQDFLWILRSWWMELNKPWAYFCSKFPPRESWNNRDLHSLGELPWQNSCKKLHCQKQKKICVNKRKKIVPTKVNRKSLNSLGNFQQSCLPFSWSF